VPIIPSAKSPRRSLLFVPGDSQRKISKIKDLRADAIILDLEDAVVLGEKESARHLVCHTLATADFGGKERLVRVNSPATSFFGADLTAVSSARPDGLVIPKVRSPVELERIDEALTGVELAHDWPRGAIRLLALIETALGIMNLKEIAQSTPRLEALLFGAEDLAADMGAVRTQAGWEIFYGRSAVVTAATANGLQAIDCVDVHIHDAAGLRENAIFGRNMGYSGKMAIHPDQVATINEIFSPSPAEIIEAQRLLLAAAAQQDTGTGVFVVDGHMVDAPIILAAELLLERARLCGLVED
jgi:citrate lyase subunit beta-like protein